MPHIKFNPELLKQSPGSMSHSVEYGGQMLRWTENSYPDVDFPYEFIVREKMLKEKVTLYTRDGSVRDNVARFVLCAAPPKVTEVRPSDEEVEAFEAFERERAHAQQMQAMEERESALSGQRLEQREQPQRNPSAPESNDDEMPPAPESASASARKVRASAAAKALATP